MNPGTMWRYLAFLWDYILLFLAVYYLAEGDGATAGPLSFLSFDRWFRDGQYMEAHVFADTIPGRNYVY